VLDNCSIHHDQRLSILASGRPSMPLASPVTPVNPIPGGWLLNWNRTPPRNQAPVLTTSSLGSNYRTPEGQQIPLPISKPVTPLLTTTTTTPQAPVRSRSTPGVTVFSSSHLSQSSSLEGTPKNSPPNIHLSYHTNMANYYQTRAVARRIQVTQDAKVAERNHLTAITAPFTARPLPLPPDMQKAVCRIFGINHGEHGSGRTVWQRRHKTRLVRLLVQLPQLRPSNLSPPRNAQVCARGRFFRDVEELHPRLSSQLRHHSARGFAGSSRVAFSFSLPVLTLLAVTA
jgi:hypothetical protein